MKSSSKFRYYGLKDVTDFAPIPWKNGKFDPEELTKRVETQERARQALDEWKTRGGIHSIIKASYNENDAKTSC